MAKAEQIVEKIPVTTYREEVTGITLTLTMDEAEALLSLTGLAEAGGPTSGIYDALVKLRIPYKYDSSVLNPACIRLTKREGK